MVEPGRRFVPAGPPAARKGRLRGTQGLGQGPPVLRSFPAQSEASPRLWCLTIFRLRGLVGAILPFT